MQPVNNERANFRGEDLSSKKFKTASLPKAVFAKSKLVNARFEDCDLSGADFTGANLTSARFEQTNLQGASFAGAFFDTMEFLDCDLRGVKFGCETLHFVSFRDSNLEGADFRRALLKKCSFSQSKMRGTQFSIRVPKIDNIHQRLEDAVGGLNANLQMERWHYDCGTVHCRAGWIVTLAGDAGRSLERDVGTDAAAALIYQASDPGLEQIPDWFASTIQASEDIKRLARERPL